LAYVPRSRFLCVIRAPCLRPMSRRRDSQDRESIPCPLLRRKWLELLTEGDTGAARSYTRTNRALGGSEAVSTTHVRCPGGYRSRLRGIIHAVVNARRDVGLGLLSNRQKTVWRLQWRNVNPTSAVIPLQRESAGWPPHGDRVGSGPMGRRPRPTDLPRLTRRSTRQSR
jgi:hypothetical protein